jgi:hypothetical protein
MITRVKIDGKYMKYDLSRVHSPGELQVGNRVLLKHLYTKELAVGQVIGIVDGAVTVEIFNRRGEADYKMLESDELYSSIYKIN